jgi:hypothetical protein
MTTKQSFVSAIAVRQLLLPSCQSCVVTADTTLVLRLMQAPEKTCQLPPQLLALVVARLDPAERLGSMARVSSAWRAAAVMATNSISAHGRKILHWGWAGISLEKATALADWLQAHAAAAALDSLAVTGHSHLTLQLPVQQLATLRSLDLDRLTLAVQGPTATALPPELSAITHLRLWKCHVGLSTLPAFTNLQHLAMCSSSDPDSPQKTFCSLPEVSSLVHLTHLHLAGGYDHDTVLGSVGAMTSLQELRVEGRSYTAAGLVALPVSLTKLCMRLPESRSYFDPPASIVTLALGTTPALAALTALRWLHVEGVTGFSAALLRDMSSLQHLVCRGLPC